MSTVAGDLSNNGQRARRRRGGAAVGLSLVAHMVVFAVIGLNASRLTYREPPPLHSAQVWLMPRLTLQQHKPAEHPAAAVRTASLSATTKPAVAPPKPPERPAPTPVQASISAAAPGKSAPPGVRPGPPPTDSGADSGVGVREALRTSVGCDADAVVHLTPYEKERCNQKVGEMAKKGPPFSGIDPLKRGRFDDQAAADERRRANRTGPLQQLIVPCEGERSNLGGGCLSDSAIMHVHQQ